MWHAALDAKEVLSSSISVHMAQIWLLGAHKVDVCSVSAFLLGRMDNTRVSRQPGCLGGAVYKTLFHFVLY